MAEDNVSTHTVKKSDSDGAANSKVRNTDDSESARQDRRIAQHEHWLRVMMEGQATPDYRYQKNRP